MRLGDKLMIVAVLAIVAGVITVIAKDMPTEPRWNISTEQMERLDLMIRTTTPTKIDFAIYPAPGQPDAIRLGYRIMQTFAFKNEWPVAIYPFDAQNSPEERGIRIAVRQGSDWKTNLKYQNLREIFGRAGFKTTPAGDPRLVGDAVAVIVGRAP